jgi:ribosomal protein L40E
MTPLVCPSCKAETSQGAYVCHRCGFSYVHVRSKPYFRQLLLLCLAACAVSASVSLVALRNNGQLSPASVAVILFVHALPAGYYLSRLRGRSARLGIGVHVQPKRYGWVATDFAALLIVGMLLISGLRSLL